MENELLPNISLTISISTNGDKNMVDIQSNPKNKVLLLFSALKISTDTLTSSLNKLAEERGISSQEEFEKMLEDVFFKDIFPKKPSLIIQK